MMEKNLLKALIPFILASTSMILYGQTRISGTVTDHKGEVIPGVNVFLLNTYDGTTSSPNGSFQFTTSEKGQQTLVAKFIGFKEYQNQFNLTGDPIHVAVVLVEEINQLQAVTITAGSFAASDESRRTIFKALDIATTAGATADIAGALNTLPGTQKVGESGRLFVRGGDGNETRTFIDGMVVLDAYSPAAPNTPSRGRFLPFMFKGTSFSTGGYSAEYGQALSSALVLNSKDKDETTRTDIGLLSVGADVAHSHAWEHASLAGKIQYTNIRPYFGLINQEVDWINPPASLEASTAYRQRIGKTNLLKVYGNLNQTNFSLYNHDIDDPSQASSVDLTNKFRHINAAYRAIISNVWSIHTGLSYTYIENKINNDGMRLNELNDGLHAKIVLHGSASEKVSIRTGGELIKSEYLASVDTSSVSLEFQELLGAVFLEADVYTSNKFVTRVGGRTEYNTLQKFGSLDPRISLAYKIGKQGQVSLAFGCFRQSAKNEWLRVNPDLESETANHYILNYQYVTENNRTLRVETYYKTYDNLVKFDEGDPTRLNNLGNGYARGFEFFWRDNRSIRNVDYWISYSYLETKRDYLNTPYSEIPTFASAHNFSAVYKHFFTRLKTQLGFTYSFTSGRPYNNPNEEKFNNGRTPYYQDVSANISYLPKPYLIVYLSCTNLLGRDNIFGYEYGTELNNEGMYNSRAIRQAAPRFLFAGIFITISKNKSINQLPSL